jgi:P-type Ca2+ transporter type 2C
MPGKVTGIDNLEGLSQEQIPLLQKQYGKNIFSAGAENRFLHILWGIFREPMFILLVVACSLYFILGSISEGIMMAVAMAIVTAISLYQEVKSSHALDALKQFTEPKITVIRDGKEQVISNEELVPGDIILLEEGMKVPADAVVLQENDLNVNESIITGESLPVEKNETKDHNLLYQGSAIEGGKCIAKVTATGNSTVLGKIGKAVAVYTPSKTMLQVQVNKFVRRLALFGLMGFLIILLVNYLHYREFATSLLFALTLAMSAVPEEIPVAFSSFMALGAYKMSKLGIISRQPQIIENLGAVTVLCLDKTGTITENRMQLKTIYDYKQDAVIDITDNVNLQNNDLLLYAVLASESNPFDSMEKAIWEIYKLHYGSDKFSEFKMIYEYPLEGRPPMMTHVYQQSDNKVIAAKGAAERILNACKMDEATSKKITQHVQNFADKGYRVIGVASAAHTNTELPAKQDDFNWIFMGLLALYDPPKKNIADTFKKITGAKIAIKLITGDYPGTAINIAGQVGIPGHSKSIIGEQVMNMSDEELKALVKTTSVFARMFPDAKMKVINALKANGEIVAMTGDGVNDAPALKSADIGIAMGQKGTEAARQASDLILTDDNLEKIITAISEGRKIYNNLIKAVRYIISIHIPIILTASLPVALGWKYPNIFTPIHVIFLELIMGPTCSIFFESEPAEKDNMLAGPRSRTAKLFTANELLTGIVQGLVITAGVLFLYYVFMNNHHSIEETRTMVFTTLIVSNVFLTFASRSFTKTMYYTSRYKNRLVPVIIIVSVALLLLLHLVPAIRHLFQLAPVSFGDFLLSSGVAFVCVMWFEVYKMEIWKRNKK